jgi:hypothetical protein
MRRFHRRVVHAAIAFPVVTVVATFALLLASVPFAYVVWPLPLALVVVMKLYFDHLAKSVRGATAEDMNLWFDLDADSVVAAELDRLQHAKQPERFALVCAESISEPCPLGSHQGHSIPFSRLENTEDAAGVWAKHTS